MRLRIEVATRPTELPWLSVLRPGRSFLYELLALGGPELGRFDSTMGALAHTALVPFGYGAPYFPDAARRRSAYAVARRRHRGRQPDP